jgi:tetratricopeptide (TPR) repeat protein
MHRLVQLATQRWLYLQGSLSNWQERALSVLSEKFPLGTYENWPICEVLSPHAQVILRCTFESKSCVLQYAGLLNNFGWYNQTQGRYKAAYKKISRAFKEREKALGKEHPSTLSSVSNLAGVLESQGKYEAAEEMNRRALDGREKALGKEHPDTLASVYCLAYLLYKQQEYNTASELYQRASGGFRKTLGLSHPTTIACEKHYSSMMQKMEQDV